MGACGQGSLLGIAIWRTNTAHPVCMSVRADNLVLRANGVQRPQLSQLLSPWQVLQQAYEYTYAYRHQRLNIQQVDYSLDVNSIHYRLVVER